MNPTDDLPRRPDPATGLPAPPPAPGPRRRPPARRMPTRPQPPPEGRGPVLAGRSGNRRDAVIVLVGGLVGIVVLEALLVGPDRLGSESPTAWGVDAVLVLLLLWWAHSVASGYLAVGADWLQQGRAWVDLYDLVEVTGGTGAYGLPSVLLRDGSGRRIDCYLYELRADPLMWDLVHLGIRWSRATREVRVNRAAEAVVGDASAR